MSRFSRCRVVLLMILLLSPTVLQAAEPRWNDEPTRSTASAGRAWSVLTQVWSFLTGAQSDNGCWIDPSGRCRLAVADNGCEFDPSGRCRAAAADNGCEVDPSGRCRLAVADNGCGADPNGRCRAAAADNGCEVDPNGRCRS